MLETGDPQQEPQQQEGNPPPGGEGGGSQPPARPDWAPEKFWDADKGELRTQDLAKSYAEAQKLIGRRGDEAKAAARQEVEAELFGKRPEKPEAYELAAPAEAVDVVIMAGKPGEDFAPEPGKTYLSLNPDSKALGMLRQMAHRAGTPPEEFQALLTEVARENGIRVPTEADRQAEAEKVWKELGEHGQRRAQHAWGQMRAVLGDRAGDLEGVLSSAKAIEAVEELLARATGSRFAPPDTGNSGGPLTEQEVEAMMRDPRYLRREPEFMAKVDRAWKTLYPA